MRLVGSQFCNVIELFKALIWMDHMKHNDSMWGESWQGAVVILVIKNLFIVGCVKNVVNPKNWVTNSYQKHNVL